MPKQHNLYHRLVAKHFVFVLIVCETKKSKLPMPILVNKNL